MSEPADRNEAMITRIVEDLNALVTRLTQENILNSLGELTKKVSDLTLQRVALTESIGRLTDTNTRFSELVIERLGALETSQNAIRTAIMDRIDRVQGTIEMLRDDSRVNWQTADVSLSNSRNLRGEVETLLGLISAMERRHQTLATQVEELRSRDVPKA